MAQANIDFIVSIETREMIKDLEHAQREIKTLTRQRDLLLWSLAAIWVVAVIFTAVNYF